MGRICLGTETLYTFKASDREWACRMLFGEAGGDCYLDPEGAAIMWTMINRYVMLRLSGDLKPTATFTRLIRNYSQPINPAWYNGGKRDPDPGHIDDREARRAAIATMAYPKDFPEGLVKLIESFTDPKLPVTYIPDDLAGTVHFYSPCFYYAKHLRKRQRQLTSAEVEFACRTAFGHGAGTKLVWAQPKGVDPQGNAFYQLSRDWRKSRRMCIVNV